MATPIPVVASHFELVGGQAGVDRIVEAFYARMDQMPAARGIRAMHPPDLTPTKVILKKYLAQWLGGPDLYSRERGHPRLRARHLEFPIGAPERDAWMLCMQGALDEAAVPVPLRDTLLEQFFKVADWMRNRDAGS